MATCVCSCVELCEQVRNFMPFTVQCARKLHGYSVNIPERVMMRDECECIRSGVIVKRELAGIPGVGAEFSVGTTATRAAAVSRTIPP